MKLGDVLLTQQDLLEIDEYFNLTKELTKGDHQKWKILKKAILSMNRSSYGVTIENDEIWASIILSTIDVPDKVMQQIAIKNKYFTAQ